MKGYLLCVSLAGLASALHIGMAQGFEQRYSCPDPEFGTTDETYAPSYVAIKTTQDNVSRYIGGSVTWHHPWYFSYFTTRRLTPTSPLGFEIETHFYNYNDAATTGLGPAYMRGWTCEAISSVVGTLCQLAFSPGFVACSLPSCYQDTQLFSDKNSLGEYAQPILAIGSYDGSMLMANADYSYVARGASGRGNRSATKINVQLQRQIQPGGGFSKLNEAPCTFSTGPRDVELVGMGAGLTSPTCIRIYYKHQSITLAYQFC